MVRGRGYARSVADFENIVARRPARAARRSASRTSARWSLGPDLRRGVSDLDGDGRGGLRHRRHAPGRERARRDRPRQGEASSRSSPGCPPGVKIVPIYDRSDLIQRADRQPDSRRSSRSSSRSSSSSCSSSGTSRARSSRSSRSRSRCSIVVHPVPDDGHHRQHHVARRHRHRHRRAGGRGHRGRRADAQEARGVGARRADAATTSDVVVDGGQGGRAARASSRCW